MFVVPNCSTLGSELFLELGEPFHLRGQRLGAWRKLIGFVVQVLRELEIDLYYLAFRAIVECLENILH